MIKEKKLSYLYNSHTWRNASQFAVDFPVNPLHLEAPCSSWQLPLRSGMKGCLVLLYTLGLQAKHKPVFYYDTKPEWNHSLICILQVFMWDSCSVRSWWFWQAASFLALMVIDHMYLLYSFGGLSFVYYVNSSTICNPFRWLPHDLPPIPLLYVRSGFLETNAVIKNNTCDIYEPFIYAHLVITQCHLIWMPSS